MWGSAYVFIAAGLESMRPPAVTLVRLLLGAALLAAVPAARRGRIAPEDRPRVALVGLLWLAVPLTLFPVAQQWVSSAVAGMITGAQPALAAAIAAVLLRRAPRRREVLGMALGLAGVAAIAVSATGHGSGSSLRGVALVVAAVVCYAVSANVTVPLQQRYGALPVILRALLVALVLCLPLGVPALLRSDPTAGSLAAMVPLGLLSTGAGYVAFATLVGRAGAARGTIAVYFVPVVALVLGVAVRGDRAGAAAIASAVLVVGSAWATAGARRR